MPDHFIDTPYAPMVGIAMAAEATESLRVGTLVLGNDYKHPSVVAKEFASIDVLSDGRVEAGIGAGWMTADYEALGLRYDSHGTRIERLGEALAILKGSWGDGPFSLDGRHYTIKNYDGIPKPTQKPHPPILVGGGGPKLLRLAGREADIVGINPNLRAGEISSDAVQDTVAAMTKQKIEWVREGAGDRFDDLELQIRYFMTSITDDRPAPRSRSTSAPMSSTTNSMRFQPPGPGLMPSGIGRPAELAAPLRRSRRSPRATSAKAGAALESSVNPRCVV